VTAQDDLVEVGITRELGSSLQTLTLGKCWRLLDLETTRARRGLDRLNAAEERARVNGGDGKRLQDRDQLLGLLLAFLAQRALTVISGPVTPAPRFGVPDEVESRQGSSHP
jgi:hypothetical protein